MTENGSVIYTAEAHVTGGRAEGHGRTSDGALEVELRAPEGRWGAAVGVPTPEQLFAIGYAACFESALGVAARRRRQDAGDVAIDSRVMLLPTDDRGFKLAVVLSVTLPSVGDTTATDPGLLFEWNAVLAVRTHRPQARVLAPLRPRRRFARGGTRAGRTIDGKQGGMARGRRRHRHSWRRGQRSDD